MKRRFLLTGGAGFIGSAVARDLVSAGFDVLNLDKLTYAGNLANLQEIAKSPHHRFVQGDICDRSLVARLFSEFQPDVVMHFAAESHVDRSLDDPMEFVRANILGTSVLLECARAYWNRLVEPHGFCFHHISTDEVYGTLDDGGAFTEHTPYDPSSPYSASKAASDHLVRAWHRSYGLPVVVTNCSNNYGPYQYPEKLIPRVILSALDGKELPVYGNGQNIRDWLYVDDHAAALYLVATKGRPGQTYNIGGNSEKTNLDVVQSICDVLDEIFPAHANHPASGQPISSYRDLIAFVPDRPGHDYRYAIDASKIKKDLGWQPQENFASGLRKTVDWYLTNRGWCAHVQQDALVRRGRGNETPS